METAAIVAIIVVIAIIAILLLNNITRLKYERKFRDWRDEELLKWQTDMEQAKRSAVNQSRAVLGGKFTEQLVPYLPDFQYDPTDARFVGSPIDMIVFPGLAQGDPQEIVILEIKTGKSGQLTPQQTKIRQLIEEGMVRWEVIHRLDEGEGIDNPP